MSITRHEAKLSNTGLLQEKEFFSKDKQGDEPHKFSNDDWSLYAPHLLSSGPNPKETISNLLYENQYQRDLLEDIKSLEKDIEDLEHDLRKVKPRTKINTPCQYQQPIKLDFSGIKPSCYRSCIDCLMKRDVYPEIYGYSHCACTSEIEVHGKKNSFGFISCICNENERPIFG